MTAKRLHTRRRGLWPILFLTLLVSASLPSAASGAFTLADERKLGKEFYDKLNQNGVIVQDERIALYVRNLGADILAHSHPAPFDFTFSVIDSSAVNAFATPGGYIYVNRGLVNLVKTESELAGVLAHEIAHVNRRHIAELIARSKKISIASLAAILASAFLGGGGELSAAAVGFSMAAATHLNLKYSREHEEEADRLGMAYLAGAGYNPQSMLDFLKSMRRYEFYSSNIPSYFLTHPGTDERIRYLDGLLLTTYRHEGREDRHGQLKRVKSTLAARGRVSDSLLRQYREDVREHPRDVDALFGLALLLDRSGQTNEALSCFRQSLALAPNDQEIRLQMGRTLLKAGQIESSIALLRTAYEQNPADASVLESLAEAYDTRGSFSEALSLYRELSRLQPANVDVLHRMAMNCGRLGQHGESHLLFGRYFKNKNRVDSAEYHYRQALRYYPPESDRGREIQSELESLKTL
ncbi:MAG: M48 family metalloprotease [Syntrophales bacterium]|jgi:predicted Zn-dependent protease|nr:M48 family metalloprotease [Syntrophales bacterium]MDD4338253.1 M48 family metalloprotease [Syntrophales bacterium]HOG06892.1 M48 family metalloprotease [Syntrophales bacterium]HOS78370.1 M48 family metalloprotease [Syntrophales bacterium]HPB71223.1 M48 family metalloprotease [Syntrophales bacterium]